MPGHCVDKCQPPVSFGASLVNEHAVHNFAEHGFHRVAAQTLDPHLHVHDTSPLSDAAHTVKDQYAATTPIPEPGWPSHCVLALPLDFDYHERQGKTYGVCPAVRFRR
jgi:hypothetical protein